jgi:hypothetical protein
LNAHQSVELEVGVSGDLPRVGVAMTKLFGSAATQFNLPEDANKYVGDASAQGKIHFLDCKGYSQSQVEIEGGPIDVDIWGGYKYDLKTLASVPGLHSGIGLPISIEKPTVIDMGEANELDLNAKFHLKAGSEVTVLGKSAQTLVNLVDGEWSVGLQVYPDVKFFSR